MIVAAWAGIRFLQGLDIFSRNAVYYASYDQVSGIQAASPILLKGVKVGTVTGISLDPQRSDNVVLQFTIKRQYRIPKDSKPRSSATGSWVAKPSKSSTESRRSISKGRYAAFRCAAAT